jgi:hypothetical protein
MGKINKRFALILIGIIAISSVDLLIVKPVNAQTPPTPSFIISTVSGTTVIPTTYSTNPDTGANITNLGYTIASFNVTITIQNNPQTTAYELDVKGHYSSQSQWQNPWGDEGNVTAFASSGSQTVITLYGDNQSEAVPEYVPNEIFLQFGGHWGIDVPFGGRVDFRLQAVSGETPIRELIGYEVLGNVSDWSPIQTVTVPDFSAVTVSPTPTLTPTSTVPEFPTWIILPLFAVMTLLSFSFARKKVRLVRNVGN